MAYPFPEEALPTFQQFKELPLVHLHVSCLKPTQYVVRIDRMEWLAAGNKPEGDDIPHCLTWKGVTYLYDGHHRWLLARLQGATWMAVRNCVIEFEEGEPKRYVEECSLPFPKRIPIDRPWSEYPMGTKAFSCTGGYWIRVKHGWQWFNGSTFPTPGGDACAVELPETQPSIKSKVRKK